MEINTDYHTMSFHSKFSSAKKGTAGVLKKNMPSDKFEGSIKLLKRSSIRDSINHFRYEMRRFFYSCVCEDENLRRTSVSKHS